jgi:hypothetical protein
MLAGDPVEATEQAQKFLKERPLVAYYDEVLMAGLKLAQADAERGALDCDRMQHIRDSVAEIADDLSSHQDRAEPDLAAEADGPLGRISKAETALSPDADAAQVPERWREGAAVLCIPGTGLIDEAAAIALAQLLERRGIGARAKEADALSMGKLFALDTNNVALVCLCYLGKASAAQIRYAARRMRRKAPEAFILICLLNVTDTAEDAEAIALPPESDVVQGSLADSVQRVVDLARADSRGTPVISAAQAVP